jgi:hypothetical protein
MPTIKRKVFETVNGKEGHWFHFLNVPKDYQLQQNETQTRPLSDLEAESYTKTSKSYFKFVMSEDLYK